MVDNSLKSSCRYTPAPNSKIKISTTQVLHFFSLTNIRGGSGDYIYFVCYMIYVMLKLSLLHTTQQHTTPTGPHEMHATPHDKGLHVTHTHTHTPFSQEDT